ncbi:MAG: UbiD family decarboxylase [Deltaproteobacteria bacterium]|nr:UbiD family decarboxylase [Deltaproteobacteria bacterium]
MAYHSLKEWIAALEEDGDLKRVKAEVDWNQEISGVIRRVYDMKEKAPALLFENLKDYKNTWGTKLFTASLVTHGRIAKMLGLSRNTPISEIVQTVRQRIKNPVKPRLVQDGSCKEFIHKGEDVNILQFPVPFWNEFDHGRYMTTFGGVITKHPATSGAHAGWQNMGLYRGEVHGPDKLGVLLSPVKHLGQHYLEYMKLKKPMEVAFVYGWDPVLPFTAATPYPAGVSEFDMMGALRGEPVEVVKCETVDLVVPAHAEIVLEGVIDIDPDSYIDEGPFGEFPGYYTGGTQKRPWAKITCVTHRKDPIFQGTLEGRTPHEDGQISSISVSVLAWDALERMGIPGITDVYCPPSVGFGTSVRVQIEKKYAGHARQIAACLWSATPTCFKNVTVVEEDIDIHDNDAMEWAFAYRVDPKEDIVVFPYAPGSALDPSSDPQWHEAKGYIAGRWNRLLIDATRTWRFGRREAWRGELFPLMAAPSDAVKQRVEERWKEFGI